VSDYGLDGRGSIRYRGWGFSSNLCLQNGSEAHPASCTVNTGGPFPVVVRGRRVMLTTHPLLVPRLGKVGSISPLSQSASMACRGATLPSHKKHKMQGNSLSAPEKTHKVPERMTDINDFDKYAIRLTIKEFYMQEKNFGSFLLTSLYYCGIRWETTGSSWWKSTAYDVCESSFSMREAAMFWLPTR
jgi:hypothetical protein